MNNNRKKKSVSMAIMLATSALLTLIVAAPGALAHDCSHEDPATNCGECPEGESHNHRYANGTTYCTASPCVDDDYIEYIRCQIARLITGA